MALNLLDPMTTDSDHLYEVIDGLPTEMPEMSVISSVLASRLAKRINLFVRDTVGEAHAEVLFKLPKPLDHNRRPDIAFVPYSAWPRNRPLPNTDAWDVRPTLCVEVVSPTDLAEEVMT
jgi:Uma2 family endonuclease